MGCDCAKTSVDRREPEERVLGLLEEGGLREIGEQTISIRAVMADSVRAFDKAGRAAALNLGDQVIQLHNDDGERANRQLRTQIRHLIERIDERMNRDDWGELSERLRVTFDEQDGRGLIDDWGRSNTHEPLRARRISPRRCRHGHCVVGRDSRARYRRRAEWLHAPPARAFAAQPYDI